MAPERGHNSCCSVAATPPLLELELRTVDLAEPLQRVRAQRETKARPVRRMHHAVRTDVEGLVEKSPTSSDSAGAKWHGGIGRIAQAGPALVFGLLQQLQALGLDIPTVLAQLGLDEKLALTLKPTAPRAEEDGER